MPAPIFDKHPVRQALFNAFRQYTDQLDRKVPHIFMKIDAYGSEFTDPEHEAKLEAFLLFVQSMAESLVVDVMNKTVQKEREASDDGANQ